MGENKHTPGPWHHGTDLRQIESGNGVVVVLVSGALSNDSVRADAHLIAAAPEMLEALEEICTAVEAVAVGGLVTAKARAAIKKARGES